MTGTRTASFALAKRSPVGVLIIEDNVEDLKAQVRSMSKFPARINIVGKARSAEDGLTIARSNPTIDAVLLDLKLPMRPVAGERAPENGLWLLEQLVSLRAGQRRWFGILVISTYDIRDAELVAQTLRLGAQGYLAKDDMSTPEFIVDSLERTVARREALSPTARLAKERAKGILDLTPREFEVWKLNRRGFSNKEIAKQLSIDLKTVEGHVNQIFLKLEVESRTQAATFPRRFPDVGQGV